MQVKGRESQIETVSPSDTWMCLCKSRRQGLEGRAGHNLIYTGGTRTRAARASLLTPTAGAGPSCAGSRGLAARPAPEGGPSWLKLWGPGGQTVLPACPRWAVRPSVSVAPGDPSLALSGPRRGAGRQKARRPRAGARRAAAGAFVLSRGRSRGVASAQAAPGLGPGAARPAARFVALRAARGWPWPAADAEPEPEGGASLGVFFKLPYSLRWRSRVERASTHFVQLQGGCLGGGCEKSLCFELFPVVSVKKKSLFCIYCFSSVPFLPTSIMLTLPKQDCSACISKWPANASVPQMLSVPQQ